MHFYALTKAEAGFAVLRARRGITLPLLLVLVLLPMAVRWLERGGWPELACPVAWIAYLWMGLLFIFVMLSCAFDLLALGSRAFGRAQRERGLLRFGAGLGLAVAIAVYGWQEARDVRLEEVSIFSDKIPVQLGEIRIVQISDVHLGLMVGEDRLRRIAELAENAGPDLLVCTGDLVDGQIGEPDGLSSLLAAIPTPLGKYAVLGNHEFYAGVGLSLDFLQRAGFTVLRGGAHRIADLLVVAGIDDRAAARIGVTPPVSEEELFRLLPKDVYAVYLKHRPLVPATDGIPFDLQLSGHGHQGQIFPFNFLVRLFFPYPSGLVEPTPGRFLYTSRGSGTWGPPLRVLAPPEVTLFRIRHPAAAGL